MQPPVQAQGLGQYDPQDVEKLAHQLRGCRAQQMQNGIVVVRLRLGHGAGRLEYSCSTAQASAILRSSITLRSPSPVAPRHGRMDRGDPESETGRHASADARRLYPALEEQKQPPIRELAHVA